MKISIVTGKLSKTQKNYIYTLLLLYFLMFYHVLCFNTYCSC